VQFAQGLPSKGDGPNPYIPAAVRFSEEGSCAPWASETGFIREREA
jgi:hypothetical protein